MSEQATEHEHVWERRQNTTSKGTAMPPYWVCIVDECYTARHDEPGPLERRSPKDDPMVAMDQFEPFAQVMTGLRARLMSDGFTADHAGDLVVQVIRQATEENITEEHKKRIAMRPRFRDLF